MAVQCYNRLFGGEGGLTVMVSPTGCLHSVGANSRELQTKNQSPCCSAGLVGAAVTN